MQSIFELLVNNKGTVSSTLGKELAKAYYDGNTSILDEAIELSSYKSEDKKEKNIRSGAAKIVEIIAEKNPELVAPNLDKLFPALDVAEPQTRWMTIRTFGFCAHLKPELAKKAIKNAESYIAQKEGLCIASSADLFLGDYGAISEIHAAEVFPILEKSVDTVMQNEHDWLLEAFTNMFKNLGNNEQEIVLSFARLHHDSERKSTVKRANKIIKLASK